MTISNQTNRTSATGTNTPGQAIAYPFPANLSSDLVVKTRITATGAEATLTLTTDYTATVSDTGGTVTMVSAIPVTKEIHIIRKTPGTQSLDLVTGGSFDAESIEDSLDKVTKLAIENKDALTRVMRMPQTDPTTLDMELPSSVDRVDKFLTFDSNGEPAVTEEKTTGTAAISAFGETLIDDANAAAAQTTLLLKDGSASLDIAGLITSEPWLDIRAFLPSGFVTDGSVDYSTEIQAAIDADPTILFIPEGIWKCSVTVDGRVNIVGTGPHSILITAGNNPVITITERLAGSLNNGRRFENFSINGNSKASKGILYSGFAPVDDDFINLFFNGCTRGIDFGTRGALGTSVRYCYFLLCDYGVYAKDSDGSAVNMMWFDENKYQSMNLCAIYLDGSTFGCYGNEFKSQWLEGIEGFALILKGTVADVTTHFPNRFDGGWFESVPVVGTITLDDEGLVTTYTIWLDSVPFVAEGGIFPANTLITDSILDVEYMKATGPEAATFTMVNTGSRIRIKTAAFDDLGGSAFLGGATSSFVIERPLTNGGASRGFIVEGLPMINNVGGHTNLVGIQNLFPQSGAAATYQDAQFLNSGVRRIALSDNTEYVEKNVTPGNSKFYAFSFSIRSSTSSAEDDIFFIIVGAGTLFGQQTITARGDRWTHYVGIANSAASAPTSQTMRFGTSADSTFDISRLQFVEFSTKEEAEAFIHSQSFAVSSTKFNTLANDATPSVITDEAYSLWLTGGTTTITDLDDGFFGQVITVIAEHSLTITDGTNIFLNGSANFTMTATDTLTLIQKPDGLWYEMSRGDNGA